MNSFFDAFNQNIFNLYEHSFDKEKGYSIMKKGNVEVFVYQLEKLNTIAKEMSDWIDQTPFENWTIKNDASSKWISEYYKQVKKEVKIPNRLFDICYDAPWVKHFYSESDIEKFKYSWRKNR